MQESRKQLYSIFFNSLVLYLLSYLVIFIPAQFITHIVAKAFHIPTVFKQFKIGFAIFDHDSLWNSDSIVSIYAAAPVMTIIACFFFYRYLIIKFSADNSNAYLFYVWAYAHSINMFFGGLAIGIPLIKGFGYVPVWLLAPFSVSLGLIVFSFILLFVNGLFLKRSFMSMAISEHYFKKPLGSLQFKFAIAILPCIIGNLLFYLLKFPDSSLYERLLLLTMFIQMTTILSFRYYHFSLPENISRVVFSKKAFTTLAGLVMLLLLWKHYHNFIFG
jgi:hypothetical protein